jgi:hypothetical protein
MCLIELFVLSIDKTNTFIDTTAYLLFCHKKSITQKIMYSKLCMDFVYIYLLINIVFFIIY